MLRSVPFVAEWGGGGKVSIAYIRSQSEITQIMHFHARLPWRSKATRFVSTVPLKLANNTILSKQGDLETMTSPSTKHRG